MDFNLQVALWQEEREEMFWADPVEAISRREVKWPGRGDDQQRMYEWLFSGNHYNADWYVIKYLLFF